MAKPCIKQLCTCEGYGDCQAVKEIIRNSCPGEFDYIICRADLVSPFSKEEGITNGNGSSDPSS